MSYTPKSKSDPIRCFIAPAVNPEAEGYDLPGWYFYDETWAYLHGPFGTLQECQQALRCYCDSL